MNTIKKSFFLLLLVIPVFFIALFKPPQVKAIDCTDGGQGTMCFSDSMCPQPGCSCQGAIPLVSAGLCSGGATGGGSCGGALAPGCDGSCPAGSICKANATGKSCVCKVFTGNCNGPYTEECKQSCSPAAARDGTCYKNGKKRTWCRVQNCKQSSPSTPVLLSPANNSAVSSTTVVLTWQKPSFGTSCRPPQSNSIQVFAGPVGKLKQVGAFTSATNPTADNAISFTYNIPSDVPAGSNINWFIIVSNNCDAINKSSAVWTFHQGGITGNVYYDPTNVCSTAQKWNINNNLKVQTSGGINSSVINGSYTLASAPGTYNVTLSGMPAGYICSSGCAQECPVATNVVSPGVANYFLTYNPGPWWQVQDSDISTNGGLESSVPLSQTFDLDGTGGFPGVPVSGVASTSITTDNVSTKKWLGVTTMTNPKIYNYQFFINQIPSNILSTFNTISQGDDVAAKLTDPSANHDDNNYYWYMYDGTANGNQPLTIPAVDIGDRKVILFVNSADANITGNISLNNGVGFFMLIVGQDASGAHGNITVDTGVGGGATANIKGLFVADNNFDDGSLNPGTIDANTSPDVPLIIRGSVIAYQNVILERDLGGSNLTTPAEKLIYAPEMMLLYPKVLAVRKINWKEVAP